MEYKYFAFISYNSKDTEWGKRLQRKLEHYRMPSTLCSEHNWKRKTPIRPVFFAPTDIQPGGLSDELKQRLDASRNLIVICSPNSAKSEWVAKEITYFYSLGRAKNIHFFIVDGVPHSGNEDTECFNPVLDKLDLPEILGANVNEKIFRFSWLNRERAYVQLITKLLGIDFDELWNRHRRLLIQQAIGWVVFALILIFALFSVFFASQPVDVQMTLHEVTPANKNLPQLKNANVSLILANETKDTTFCSIGDKITFTNVPADMIGKEVRVLFTYNIDGTDYYMPVDSTLTLSEDVVLNVSRNAWPYGHVKFELAKMVAGELTPLPNTQIAVEGVETRSDSKGVVDVFIPLKKQSSTYHLTSREVKLPEPLIDVPCGDSNLIIAE